MVFWLDRPPLVVDAWPIWEANIWAQITSSGRTKSAPCIPQSELASWEKEDTDPPHLITNLTRDEEADSV